MVVHRYYANSFVPSPEHSWGAHDPPNTAYVHPEGFSFPFCLGILRHQSLHLCVTGDITTKKMSNWLEVAHRKAVSFMVCDYEEIGVKFID